MAAMAALLAFSAPVIAADMDSRITISAKDSYVFKTYLQDDDIRIQSRDGAVTLTGMVLEESHKSLAQDTLAGLPGVTSVDNRLEVKAETQARSPDEWLATKVKTALMFHSSVSAGTTRVKVKYGIVTLQGEAANEAQKELTTEYARDVEGVKGVKNDMTVAGDSKKLRTVGETIDDASITAQVKLTLLYHRSTSAIKTSVTTRDGVVTLSGKAGNSAELDLASKLASDIYGVKDVKNLMTVE
jgi:osmotically-inducible protein OsmY